ncbi:MAG: HesB/IscA family protein [Alphaproteobacteria bacterium]
MITITKAALKQMKYLIDKCGKPVLGIRIRTLINGCLGLSYSLEFAYEKSLDDKIITQDEISIFIDPKSVLFVVGMEIDFVEENFESGFVFKNPNEKNRCKCGKSFNV